MAIDRSSNDNTAPDGAVARSRRTLETVGQNTSDSWPSNGVPEAAEDISFDDLQRMADEEESKHAEGERSKDLPDNRSHRPGSEQDPDRAKVDSAADITFDELQALAAEEEAKHLALNVEKAGIEGPADASTRDGTEVRDLDSEVGREAFGLKDAPLGESQNAPGGPGIGGDTSPAHTPSDSAINDSGTEQGKGRNSQGQGRLDVLSADRSPAAPSVASEGDPSVSPGEAPSPDQTHTAKAELNPEVGESAEPESVVARQDSDDLEGEQEPARSLPSEATLQASSDQRSGDPDSDPGVHTADPATGDTERDADKGDELGSNAGPGRGRLRDQPDSASEHDPDRPSQSLGEVNSEGFDDEARATDQTSSGERVDAVAHDSTAARQPDELLKRSEASQSTDAMASQSDLDGPLIETEPLPRIDEFSEDDDEKGRAEKFGNSLARDFDDVRSQARGVADIVDKILEPPPTGRPTTRANPHSSYLRETPHQDLDGGNLVTALLASAIAVSEIARRIGEKIKRSDKE